MAKAPVETEFSVKGFEDLKLGIIKWPMSVIRVRGAKKERLVEFAEHVLEKWRGYTDEKAFILAETDGEKHNTLNPIARRRGQDFELDLVLRNNITTEEHPLGVYHPHAELHHIKKENIGLIEVMGLAILPGRLKAELSDLNEALRSGKDISAIESLSKHADWCKELCQKYDFVKMNEKECDEVLKEEVGHVFSKVLEHAGVYKYNDEGKEAFLRFIEQL
jgi:UDPglucose--hexose-1-phosphate uridylyltransferase